MSSIDVAECGVIDMDFAVGIVPSSGLRNRLVHEYEKFNDETVYSSIDQVINMYTEYMVYFKHALFMVNLYVDILWYSEGRLSHYGDADCSDGL